MSMLPASPPACPDTPTAEGAFESMSQQKAFDYQAVHANCKESSSVGNIAFAKNVYDEAVACPK